MLAMPEARTRGFYGRVAVIGLALMVFASALDVVAAGDAAFPLPFVAVVAVPVIFAYVRATAWPFAVAAFFALPPVLFGFEDLSIWLGTADSFLFFWPALLFRAGLWLLLIGAIVTLGLRSARKRRPRGSMIERAALALVVAAVLAAGAVSAGQTLARSSEIPLRDRATARRVAIGDDWYRPESLDVQAGQELTLWLVNEGEATHTFTIDELDMDRVMIPGRELIVKVRRERAGRLVYYCRVSGHDRQKGVLTIEA